MIRKRNIKQVTPLRAHLLRFTEREEKEIRLAKIKAQKFMTHFGIAPKKLLPKAIVDNIINVNNEIKNNKQ